MHIANPSATLESVSSSQQPLSDHATVAPLRRDLAHEVSAALGQHPYFRQRALSVEEQAGRIVLSGVVATFYHKQVAEEMTRKIDGVHTVENRLHVCW